MVIVSSHLSAIYPCHVTSSIHFCGSEWNVAIRYIYFYPDETNRVRIAINEVFLAYSAAPAHTECMKRPPPLINPEVVAYMKAKTVGAARWTAAQPYTLAIFSVVV